MDEKAKAGRKNISFGVLLLWVMGAGLGLGACQESQQPAREPARAAQQEPEAELAKVAPQAPPAGAYDEQGVRAAFQSFKQALIERDSKPVLQLISRKTLERYDAIIAVAGTIQPQQATPAVKHLKLSERVILMAMLLRFEASEIASMSALELLDEAVGQGWLVSGELAQSRLGSIQWLAEGSIAIGQEENPVRAPRSWQFILEEEGWKVDLRPFLDRADRELRDYARRNGISERETLLDFARQMTPKVGNAWAVLKGAGFTVEVPRKPEHEVVQEEPRMEIWRSQSLSGADFLVISSFSKEKPEDEVRMDAAMRTLIQSLGGKGLGEVMVRELQGRKLRSFQFELQDKRIATVMMVATAEQLLQLVVLAQGDASAADLERFFDSLSFD